MLRLSWPDDRTIRMYQSLQASRAIAAALVVLFHLGGLFASDKYFGYKWLDGPFAWGDAGVDFFFVLSGFIITHIHRKDFGTPGQLPGYFMKRALRIFPTYWLVCAALFAAALAMPSLRQALPTDPLVILKALLLVPQDPAIVGGTGSPILFVAWSLQYELLFYAVVAIAIASRVAGLALLGVIVGNYLGCHFGGSCSFPQEMFASHYVVLFGIGVVSAYVTKSRLAVPRPLLVALVGMVLFVAFGLLETPDNRDTSWIDRRLVYGIFSGLIVIGLTRAEAEGELVLRQRWIALLGDSSYMLYLVHMPIISTLVKTLWHLELKGPVAVVAAFGLSFVACMGIAVVLHLLIEKPLLERLGRRLKTPAAPRPASAARAPARPTRRVRALTVPRNGPEYRATLQ
jgi:peptidoglycan/LPS O-acetylase OafA/YrhL